MDERQDMQRHIDALIAQGLLDRAEIERLHAAADDLTTQAEHDTETIEGLQSEIARGERAISNLETALGSRDVLGQAKGIIMSATGCDADEAWQLIVDQSQRQNRKVGEIAAELIARAHRDRPGA